MTSLKAILNCLDINTDRRISVLVDFFGFSRRRVPTDPSARARVSVKRQIQRVQQRHVHLNVIRVGFDALSTLDQDRRNERIDYAIYRAQDIYEAVNLGIGRVKHWQILAADADGLDDIGNEDEAAELVARATVYNDGIDCFVVRNISDTSFSGDAVAICGSCEKGSKTDGIVAAESGLQDESFAKVFSHELGHHLGLKHNHDDGECPTTIIKRNNLMAKGKCAVPDNQAGRHTAVALTPNQGSIVRKHCSTHGSC